MMYGRASSGAEIYYSGNAHSASLASHELAAGRETCHDCCLFFFY
jgi:hypothetical protein